MAARGAKFALFELLRKMLSGDLVRSSLVLNCVKSPAFIHANRDSILSELVLNKVGLMLSPFFVLTLPTVNHSVNTVSAPDGIKLLRHGFFVFIVSVIVVFCTIQGALSCMMPLDCYMQHVRMFC